MIFDTSCLYSSSVISPRCIVDTLIDVLEPVDTQASGYSSIDVSRVLSQKHVCHCRWLLPSVQLKLMQTSG